MTLTAPGGKVPKDVSWPAGKKYMGNVDAFLKSLLHFDKVRAGARCMLLSRVHAAAAALAAQLLAGTVPQCACCLPCWLPGQRPSRVC